MDVDTIPNLLADQRDAAPEHVQHFFLQFEDLWERKLWHELTNELVLYFQQDQSQKQRLPLYNNFIKTFAEKINQLQLVTLGLSTASQCKGTIPHSYGLLLLPVLTLSSQMTTNASPSSPPSLRASTSPRRKMPLSTQRRPWPTSSCA
jgi:hypothetical protein